MDLYDIFTAITTSDFIYITSGEVALAYQVHMASQPRRPPWTFIHTVPLITQNSLGISVPYFTSHKVNEINTLQVCVPWPDVNFGMKVSFKNTATNSLNTDKSIRMTEHLKLMVKCDTSVRQ
jgi:hypothetical protein